MGSGKFGSLVLWINASALVAKRGEIYICIEQVIVHQDSIIKRCKKADKEPSLGTYS